MGKALEKWHLISSSRCCPQAQTQEQSPQWFSYFFFSSKCLSPSATFFEIQQLNFISWAHYVSLFMMPMKGNISSKMRPSGGFSLTKVESGKRKSPEEWRSRESWERAVSPPHRKGKRLSGSIQNVANNYICVLIFSRHDNKDHCCQVRRADGNEV